MAPKEFPEKATPEIACAKSSDFVEREHSMTCPRQMLCNWNVGADGVQYGTLIDGTFTRCNIEGYNGLDYEKFGNMTRQVLASFPEGRCPYPPGDRPGLT